MPYPTGLEEDTILVSQIGSMEGSVIEQEKQARRPTNAKVGGWSRLDPPQRNGLEKKRNTFLGTNRKGTEGKRGHRLLMLRNRKPMRQRMETQQFHTRGIRRKKVFRG